jgi:hypothetical protein
MHVHTNGDEGRKERERERDERYTSSMRADLMVTAMY